MGSVAAETPAEKERLDCRQPRCWAEGELEGEEGLKGRLRTVRLLLKLGLQ